MKLLQAKQKPFIQLNLFFMKNIYFTLLLIINFNTFAQVPPHISTNGLIGYWGFNSNANDESGNGNHGIVSNATLTTDRFGKTNSAYIFNGKDSRIDVNKAFFDVGWNDYTISCWINSSSVDNSNNYNNAQAILNTDPHNGIALNTYGSSNPFKPELNNKYSFLAGTDPSVRNWDVLPLDCISKSNRTVNTWNHLVVVKKGTSYSFYLNGVFDKTFVGLKAVPSNLCKIVFGNLASNIPDEGFLGKLDDFTIWNRGLSQTEITSLFNSTPTEYIAAQYSPSFKNAIKLNGSTDYVNLSALGKENLGNEVTYEAWINTDDIAKQMAVVTRGSNDNVNGMGFGIENGKIWASGSNTGIWDVAYAGNITAFKWIHIAASYDKTLGQIKIYQNGELVSTSNRTFVIDGSTFNMNIGRNHTTAIQYFSRKIDDVRVWNTIRTQAEIQNNMNKELAGTETGLVAYYKMNEVGKGNGITVNNSAMTGLKFNGITVGGTDTPIFISCIGDLSLTSKSLNQTVKKDSTGTISFTLKNQSSNTATNIKVLLKIPYTPPFVIKNSQNCTKGTFESNMWAIPELVAGDSCVLNLIYQPTQSGIWYVEAEVFSADQEDTDSTPKNGLDIEDDFSRACFSIPIKISTEPFGMQLMLDDPKLTTVQWYNDGQAIQGQTKNVLQITALGKYGYSSNGYKCPDQGCCPFIIEKAIVAPNCCTPLEYILERTN